MLELQELQGLKINQIVDLLRGQESKFYDIYIPKSTKQFFSDPQDIAIDYAELAYVGQRLYDISEDFEYKKVKPEEQESVLFKISVQDLNNLAETLLEISYGYINDPEDEEFIFAELVEGFLEDVENCKVAPACPYFVEIYKEFMAAEDDEKLY